MPEPTTTTVAATYVATAVAVPIITAFGVPLGLRADHLVAGLSGSMVAMVLLNSVPSTGDIWSEMVRTTLRRMFVALASSLTAGYLTPLLMVMINLSDSFIVGAAFAVGGGAQQFLSAVIKRLGGQVNQSGGNT